MAITEVEWTATVQADGTILPGYTFNPWQGCTHAHTGCLNCYAENMADRWLKKVSWGPHGTRKVPAEDYWRQPLSWNRWAEKIGTRLKVFCASMGDVFEDWKGPMKNLRGDDLARCERKGCQVWIPAGTHYGEHVCPTCGGSVYPQTMDDVRARLFELIDQTPHLDWLLLTKRPQNIARMWPGHSKERTIHQWGKPGRGNAALFRSNVWLGTSVSNQATAEDMIPHLASCREMSPVLFLSCEPLVDMVDLRLNIPAERILRQYRPMVGMVDWVIVGGESGRGARECEVDDIRFLVGQCEIAGTPVFVKQLGARPTSDHIQDWPEGTTFGGDSSSQVRLNSDKGGDPAEWPEDLRVRKFPQPAGVPCGT